MYRDLRVAVVIPAYNEEPLVGRTVATLPSWVDRVLVVDDASTDATAQVARAAARGRTGFELLRHEHNRGVGAAIASGYRRALELAVDATVVVGADAQMDPADMDRLLDPLARGEADYTKGNRLCWPGVTRVMPRVRWLGNWALTWLTRPVSGYWRVTDSQCGYTAITRLALTRLPLEQLYPRYGYPNDLLAWLGVLGQRVVDVPVRPVYGSERSGIHVLRIILPLLALLLSILVRRLRWNLAPARHRALLQSLPPTPPPGPGPSPAVAAGPDSGRPAESSRHRRRHRKGRGPSWARPSTRPHPLARPG